MVGTAMAGTAMVGIAVVGIAVVVRRGMGKTGPPPTAARAACLPQLRRLLTCTAAAAVAVIVVAVIAIVVPLVGPLVVPLVVAIAAAVLAQAGEGEGGDTGAKGRGAKECLLPAPAAPKGSR